MQSPATSEQGFSLIEVLLAWVILLSVLLGLVAVNSNSLRTTTRAYWRSLAAVKIMNMLERLEVNPSRIGIDHQLLLWNKQNQQMLPSGHGYLNCNQNDCEIKMTWDDGKLHTLKITKTL